MTAPPDIELNVDSTFQELTEQLADIPVSCEFTYNCPTHGPEPCEYRARWVARVQCKAHRKKPHEFRMLACDPCHDELESAGNESRHLRVLEWQPL